MKKTLTTIAFGALFLAPMLASAASIQLTPSTVNVVAGQNFTVTVMATPSGSPLYTASANLQFSPSILSASSFSFAPTWMSVTQNGYDLMDNVNGSVIKTGGFPNGFSTPTVLGTVTFHAKQAGTATITVTGDSVLLDGGSNNELSGQQGTVTVNVSNAPTTITTQTTASVPTPGNAVVPTGTTASTTTGSNANQAAAAASALGTSSQTAAVGSLFNGVPMWVWWTLLVIVLLGLIYWAWNNYSKRA